MYSMHTHAYVYLNPPTHTICISICMYSIWIYTCTLYAYMCTCWIHVHISICMHMHVWCMYICTCICIIHVHTHEHCKITTYAHYICTYIVPTRRDSYAGREGKGQLVTHTQRIRIHASVHIHKYTITHTNMVCVNEWLTQQTDTCTAFIHTYVYRIPMWGE